MAIRFFIMSMLCLSYNIIESKIEQREELKLVVSLPKSGTHLVLKLLDHLGIKNHFSSYELLKIDPKDINNLKADQFYVTHAPCLPANLKALKGHTIKGIFIYRDPRDVLISDYYWIKKYPPAWPHLKNLSFNDLLFKLIYEYNSFLYQLFSVYPYLPLYKSIEQFYNLYLPWQNIPGIYTTAFERLIGPQGGGKKYTQIREILQIAHHFNKRISIQEAENIADKLFGGTNTFRKGEIGSWQDHFTYEHKIAFKKVTRTLLVKLKYEKNDNW